MKIRKLRLKAKLEQIKKENQNIFVFHCSVNAVQWRYIKNFLYNELQKDAKQNRIESCSPANLSSESLVHKKRPYGAFFYSGTSKKTSIAKGCLFFFNTRSINFVEKQINENICFTLINKIELLHLNNNPILLYGQMKFNSINHIDVKETLLLNKETSYQQFLFFIQFHCILLNYYLYQNINKFMYFQENRISLDNLDKKKESI